MHELCTYRVRAGRSVDELIRFFHADGERDYHAALRRADIALVGAWRDAARPDALVWLRASGDATPKAAAWLEKLAAVADMVAAIEALELAPRDVSQLAAGPRDRGCHELRHYRLAPGTTGKMLAFFEDVRRLMPEHGVRVLGWWTATHAGSERFLWLREFRDAAHQRQVTHDLYQSDRWLRDFKPRTIGVIEERILRDLVPVPAAALGGLDPMPGA
ncbi:MAG: NIPSNAP family protein [Planctomycetota bacterium]